MGGEEGGMARQAGREGSALNGVSENNKDKTREFLAFVYISLICLENIVNIA